MERNDIVKAIKMVMGLLEKENPEVHKAVASEINDLIAPKQEVVFKPHPTLIFEYIKERKHKVGVLVGVRQDDVVWVGWSKCNRKMDKFSFDEGMSLAESRAIKLVDSPKLPDCLEKKTRQFGSRCLRYFKGVRSIEMPV